MANLSAAMPLDAQPTALSRLDFSQSSLQDYADCPRRFQLRYMQQMPWPAIEAEPPAEVEARQRAGQDFHQLIHRYLLGLATPDLEQTIQSAQVTRWWSNFLRAKPDLHGWASRSELALSCAVGQHRLVAKYDLIAFRDDRAVIYDWKTWARRPTDSWLASRWQTRVYRALLVKGAPAINEGLSLRPESLSMVYWFAEFPEEPAVLNYDFAQWESDWAGILETIGEILDQERFPMTANRRMCRFCVYRSHCDRGGPAAMWEEAVDEPSSEPAPTLDSDDGSAAEL
jgi:hypothetical protein